MAEIKRKEIRISEQFDQDIIDVFSYGEDTFGYVSAKSFISDIYSRVWSLDEMYLMHPECRYLKTKTKKYRNIILGAYLIIYRVIESRVEVLRILRAEASIQKIKNVRNTKV